MTFVRFVVSAVSHLNNLSRPGPQVAELIAQLGGQLEGLRFNRCPELLFQLLDFGKRPGFFHLGNRFP